MARQKSALRKRLNGRWLRWMFWRGVFGVLPLAQRYSFPMKSAGVGETALQIIEDESILEAGAFTPAQIEDIVRPALTNDKIRGARTPIGSSRFRRQIAIVPDCAVFGHVGAVMRSSDGAILYNRAGGAPNWNIAKPRKLTIRRLDDSLATALLGTHQYYHFFERLLPLLRYLEQMHPRGAPLKVLVAENGPPFQRSVCDAVAARYPDVAFVTFGKGERIEIPRYLWLHEAADNTEWLPVDAERAERLGALMRSHYRQPQPTGGELLFFSRGKSPLRKLTNEAELEAIAASRGFQRFEAVAGNHAEQVRRFGNAEVIVAVHGAGLANLLFARPGTAVIEIFPGNFVKSTYAWLSNRLNLRHYSLIGSTGDYDQTFHLDAKLFAAKLDALVAAAGHRKADAMPAGRVI